MDILYSLAVDNDHCLAIQFSRMSYVMIRVISMKAGRVKVEVRLIVSPFYPSCRQHADKWCFFWRAHSTVRSRSFFVSSSGLNHTTELGLMSIITNSQPSPWNHGPCSVPTY